MDRQSSTVPPEQIQLALAQQERVNAELQVQLAQMQAKSARLNLILAVIVSVILALLVAWRLLVRFAAC